MIDKPSGVEQTGWLHEGATVDPLTSSRFWYGRRLGARALGIGLVGQTTEGRHEAIRAIFISAYSPQRMTAEADAEKRKRKLPVS